MKLTDIEKAARKPVEEVPNTVILEMLTEFIEHEAQFTEFERRRIGAMLGRYRKPLMHSLNALLTFFLKTLHNPLSLD